MDESKILEQYGYAINFPGNEKNHWNNDWSAYMFINDFKLRIFKTNTKCGPWRWRLMTILRTNVLKQGQGWLLLGTL